MKKNFFPERKIQKESCHSLRNGWMKVCGSLTQKNTHPLPRGCPWGVKDSFPVEMKLKYSLLVFW